MKYDAFISYRHSDLDMYVAKKIHKGLETFKVPRSVAKKYGKKSIKRVFRDQEELPIGSDLGDNIANALKESEYLLVICSPRTPDSYWVQKEIDSFIEMHGREHVLAVLIEGEPNQSFPKQLLVDDAGNPVEPLAADVRGKSKGEVNRKLKTEIMRLAAPILGCSYDDLRQRHRERKIKRVAAIASLVAALGVAFGAYSAYNAMLIQQNYQDKLRNQSKFLAEKSLSLLEAGDRRAAALVALEALPFADESRPYVPEAQYALTEALYAYDTGSRIKMDRVLLHDLPVREFYFNEEGTRVVSLDQGYNTYVWDVNTGEKLVQVAPGINELGYVVTPVAVYLYENQILLCEKTAVSLLDHSGEAVWRVELPDAITYCTFDESSALAVCVDQEQLFIVDVAKGELKDKLMNPLETSFSAEQAFSKDKTKIAVSHIDMRSDAPGGRVTIYDVTTKEVTTLETQEAYIAEVAFTEDDCLAVAQMPANELLGSDDNLGFCTMQKISCETGEVLWQDGMEYQLIGSEAASAQIKCRQDQVLMSIDNHAYTWDEQTGELLAHVQVDAGISDFLVASNSQFGFLAQQDGTVDIVDMSTGTKYSDSAVETDKLIQQLYLRKGIMAFRSYAAPELTLMKYPDQADCRQLDTLDETIQKVMVSPKETHYAISVYDFDVSSRIFFYRTEDNTLLDEWIEEEGGSVQAAIFLDENTFMILSGSGMLKFYDIGTGDVEEMDVSETFYVSDCYVNHNKSFAVLECGSTYGIVDLQKRELVTTGEAPEFILGAMISEDGKTLYCSIKENGVCIIDVTSGEVTSLQNKGYEMFSGSQILDAIAVSENGKLVAVGCVDGKMRVWDCEAQETVAEIPFTGINRSFIRFVENDTHVMMQGDDYYYKVYDLGKGEYAYLATEQYNQIKSCVMIPEEHSIAYITTAGIMLLDAGNYAPHTYVEGGIAYFTEKNTILAKNNRTLYEFPYMTLDLLYEEATEQFGDQPLSNVERIKYNVE